jgi:hypothetical protein
MSETVVFALVKAVVVIGTEMGWECGTCGGDERCMKGLMGNLREREHLKDPGVDGRIILKWVLETCDGGHGLARCGSG